MNFIRKKITDITENRQRTVEKRDKSGKLIREKIQVKAWRKVKVVFGWKRFAHYFFDMLILRSLTYGFGLLLNLLLIQFPSFSLEISLFFFSVSLGWMLVMPLYYGFFEGLIQTTPGKLLMGCVVIDMYGEKPPPEKIALRSIIRIVPFEAFSCMGERGWHDQWSETWVVSKAERDELQRLLREQETNPVFTSA